MSGWREQAACRGTNATLFYSTTGNNTDAIKAKEVCNGKTRHDGTIVTPACPVKGECKDYWLSFTWYADFGIWFGTTETERTRMKLRSSRKTVAA